MNVVLWVFFIGNVLILSTGHRIQKRVTYGSEATPHSRPYQVHNIMMLKNGDVQICGGALISQKYVLTAAHCFVNMENIVQTVVIMGAHDLRSQDKEVQITRNYVIHDDFEHFPEGHTKNDIALIKLESPVELTKNIQLIALPRRSQVNESFNDAMVTEAGWGKTETDDTSFILIEGTSQITDEKAVCTHPNALLCTLSIDAHAPCVGDSGSPLVLQNTLIGIVSSGYCIAFSYHTRITSFLHWIEGNSDVQISD